MVNSMQVRTVIGIIGNVISFGLFASPLPTFWKIYKKKAVEEFQPWPYVTTLLNCMLWVFYGLPVVHKDSILVSTINGVGLVVEAFYILLFLYYCSDQKHYRKKIGLYVLGEIIGVALVILITLFLLKSTFAKQTFVGVICDAFNICMYGVPSLKIIDVVRTKSVAYMPFWLSFVGFVNAAVWTTYSLVHQLDLYVLISNGLGTFLAASQLIVYFIYYKSTPKGKTTKPSEIEISATERV